MGISNTGRVPSRPLSYDQINNIANFKGEFTSTNSLPTSGVHENDYAIVNGKCYKYNNGWQEITDPNHVTPVPKEIIIDYNNNRIYICDENRNIVQETPSNMQESTASQEEATTIDDDDSLSFYDNSANKNKKISFATLKEKIVSAIENTISSLRSSLNSLTGSLNSLTDSINNHISNKNNPHNVTASQIGAQEPLEFTPVQQGAKDEDELDKYGIAYSNKNKLRIGWDDGQKSKISGVKVSVDDTDMGHIITDCITGTANRAKLPASKISEILSPTNGGTGVSSLDALGLDLGLNNNNLVYNILPLVDTYRMSFDGTGNIDPPISYTLGSLDFFYDNANNIGSFWKIRVGGGNSVWHAFIEDIPSTDEGFSSLCCNKCVGYSFYDKAGYLSGNCRALYTVVKLPNGGKLPAGKYTLSFYVSVKGSSIHVCPEITTDDPNKWTKAKNNSITEFLPDANNTGKWIKRSMSVTIPNATDILYVTLDSFAPDHKETTTNGVTTYTSRNIRFTDIKLEYGSISTPYSADCTKEMILNKLIDLNSVNVTLSNNEDEVLNTNAKTLDMSNENEVLNTNIETLDMSNENEVLNTNIETLDMSNEDETTI